MVQFGYYKVMSNIPKMGQLPTPEKTPKSSWKFLTGHDSWLGSHWPSIKKRHYQAARPQVVRDWGRCCFHRHMDPEKWKMAQHAKQISRLGSRKQPLHTYDILLFWCKQRMYIIYIYIYIFIHIYTYIYNMIYNMIYIYIHLYVYFMISIIVYL